MPIPIITRANQSVEAQTPGTVQMSTGPARVLEYLGDTLASIAAETRQKAKEKYAADIDVTIKTETARIERENLGDPDKMNTALKQWRDGYIGGIEGRDMQDFAAKTFDMGIISPINRAYATQRTNMDNAATQSLFLQIEANQASIANSIDDIFSADPKIAASGWNVIVNASETIYKASSVTGADGMALISGQAGANLVTDTKDKLMSAITLKWLGSQSDAMSALQQLQNGEASFTVTDGEKSYTLNLMESLTPEARKQVLYQAEQYVNQGETLRKQATADAVSMASLAISRGQFSYADLEKIKGQLDPQQYAQLSKELDKANDVSLRKVQNYGEIADAMGGKAVVLDLADPQVKKDINGYYENVVVPSMAKADANTQINVIADYVKKTGVVPQNLLGQMKSAFRTGNVDAIRFYASIVGQIKESSPQAFNDIPKADIAFGEVVADMVNAGEPPEEAIKIAREMVNPANRAVVDARTVTLKERKRDDYAKEVKGLFDSWIPFVGVKVNPNTQAGAAVIADYKTQYDTYYKLTGNENVARNHAVAVIKGMYGVTEFNGKAVIAHPPEKYYSINGLDNQNWMIQQLVDDVRKSGRVSGVNLRVSAQPQFETVQAAAGYRVLKNAESAFKAVIPQGDPLENKVFLLSDNETERTAASGRPNYKIMYIHETGVLFPVLKQDGTPMRWAPVIEKGKAHAIKKAQTQAVKNEPVKMQRQAQYGY
ncbi:MAG: hypothetical protein HGA87_01460 [Desulfobulbaceae bacterium]|nr:hypothetical protein [Desulfobulbaceae bacterium]